MDIKGKHSDDAECEDDDGNDEACTLDHTMLGNIQAPNGDYVGGDGNFDDTDDDIGGTVLHVYGGGGDRGQHPLHLHRRPDRNPLPEGGRPTVCYRGRQRLPRRDLQAVGPGGELAREAQAP